jgi:hypothetical protein
MNKQPKNNVKISILKNLFSIQKTDNILPLRLTLTFKVSKNEDRVREGDCDLEGNCHLHFFFAKKKRNFYVNFFSWSLECRAKKAT